MSRDVLRTNEPLAHVEAVPAPARLKWTTDTWTWIFVAVGVFLRILEYSDNRALYIDETNLKNNLVGRAFYDFHTPLSDHQSVPPGFLAVERLMILLPLPFKTAARLIPFLCAIGSMFLMRSVAKSYLSEAAVPIAVGLFALVDWLLYYSVEIKQYGSDAALALAALLLAAGTRRSGAEGSPWMSPREWLALAAFGTIGVWFSHPLALVLAGVGTYLVVKAAIRKDWRRTFGFMAMSLLWASSFAVCFRISHSIISKDDFLTTWWDFAFLPFPARSLADLERVFWHTTNLLNSPSGVLTPLGVLPSAFIALALFLLGAWSLGRKWKGGVFLLASPILFALVASMLHQYPFHGRLLLFLVPSVHLLVAQGAAALSRPGGAKLTFALGALLLTQPLGDVLWHRLIMKRSHQEYDSHGDLSRDLLDYLEWQERAKELHQMLERAKLERRNENDAVPADLKPPSSPP